MSKEIETKPSFTDSDKEAFAEYTRRIKAGAKTFVEVGSALIAVRDKRYYLMSHGTFEDYCQETCGFNRKRAHQLMDAATVVQALPKNLSTVVDTERKARILKKIKPEKRADAVKKAAKNGDSVAQALEDIRKQQEEEAGIATHEATDCEGYPIPAGLEEFYDRRSETDAILRQLTQVRVWFKKLWDANDPLVRYVPQHVRQHLDDAWTCIKESRPDVVCLHCDGKNSEKCGACKGTGFISRWRADNDTTGKRSARNKKLKK